MANDYSPYLKGDARSKANPGASPVKFDAEQARRYNDSVAEAEAVTKFLAQHIPASQCWRKLRVVDGVCFAERLCLLNGSPEVFRNWRAIEKTDDRLIGEFSSPKELAIHLGLEL